MKLMFFSDLHGSSYYLDKVLEQYNIVKPDKLIDMGDILYHGPRNDLPKDYNPKYVYNKINEYKDNIIGIKGNCDAEVDEFVLDFKLNDSLMVEVDGLKMFLIHGQYVNENNPVDFKTDVVILGHFHIPYDKVVNNTHYINPGSISMPKENTNHSFMVYENRSFTWYNEDGVIFKTITL